MKKPEVSVKIYNETRKKLITSNAKFARSFIDQVFGLLLKSNQLKTLIFKTRFGIHTFFLKQAIEVIVLDQNLNIVKIKNVKPNQFFFWHPKFFWVIELPKNSLINSKTKAYDKLNFDPKLNS